MTKLSFIIVLFISILAPASSFAFTTNSPIETAEQAPEVEIAAIGFDKVLNMVIMSEGETNVNVQILDKADHIKYASQVLATDMEVVEVDLKRLPAGTYTLKITLGDHTQTENGYPSLSKKHLF